MPSYRELAKKIRYKKFNKTEKPYTLRTLKREALRGYRDLVKLHLLLTPWGNLLRYKNGSATVVLMSS